MPPVSGGKRTEPNVAQPQAVNDVHAGPGKLVGHGVNDPEPFTLVMRATQTGLVKGHSASEEHSTHPVPIRPLPHIRLPSAFSMHHSQPEHYSSQVSGMHVPASQFCPGHLGVPPPHWPSASQVCPTRQGSPEQAAPSSTTHVPGAPALPWQVKQGPHAGEQSQAPQFTTCLQLLVTLPHRPAQVSVVASGVHRRLRACFRRRPRPCL